MPSGGSIINTASVDAYAGPPAHVDYAASKGAIIAFTRALANQQAARGIRVNAVAPGPVWTPLITASLGVEAQKGLPGWTTMGRIGQPVEAATSFVFLASQDGSFMTGQTMHPNGGIAVGSLKLGCTGDCEIRGDLGWSSVVGYSVSQIALPSVCLPTPEDEVCTVYQCRNSVVLYSMLQLK